MLAALAGIVGNALITKGSEQLIGGGKTGAGSAAFEDMALGQKKDRYIQMAKDVKRDTAGQMYGAGKARQSDMSQVLNSIYSQAYNAAPNMAKTIINQAIAEQKSDAVIKQLKYDMNFSEMTEGKRLRK
jgi:hypothetical protein